MPRGLVAMARSGGYCPLRVSGGILCSERGQSRDVFQEIRLEDTSPRCNNGLFQVKRKVLKTRAVIMNFFISFLPTSFHFNLFMLPRGDAGGISREYVPRIPSVS